MREILIRNNRDPLFGFSREEVLSYIVAALRPRAQELYIYGSFARDDMHAGSDIDIFIVADTDTPFVERGTLFEDLRNKIPSIEILVYTPEEFQRLTQSPSPGFWRSAARDMIRLF